MKSSDIKEFYEGYHDQIYDKRYASKYPIRKYAHWTQLNSIADLVEPGESVLDAGCGEGMLLWKMAERGADVSGLDISRPNLDATKKFLDEKGVQDVKLVQGDLEKMPFEDNSFDVVASSHVLEHLPDFDQGLAEIHRVTKKRAIIALPTCLNLSAASLLGGVDYWYLSKSMVYAVPLGFMRILKNLGGEGVQEGYAGDDELPHIWRYPWVMKRRLKKGGFDLKRFEASTLIIPYFGWTLPLVKFLDKHKHRPVLNNFGYGSIAVLEKRT